MTASRDDVVGSEERRYKSALTKSQRKMMKGALENLKKVKMNIEEYESKLRAGTFDPIAIRDSIMDDFEVITNAEEVGRGSGALTASIITSRHRAECERVLAELFILTNGNETILEAVPDAEKGYAEDLLSFQRKARRYQNELQAGPISANRIEHIGNGIAFGRVFMNIAMSRSTCIQSGFLKFIMSRLQESYEELDEILLKIAVDDRLKVARLEEALDDAEAKFQEQTHQFNTEQQTVSVKNDVIERLESMVEEERSKISSLEGALLTKDEEIVHLRNQLQSSERHLSKTEYKKLSSDERTKLKLDRSNAPISKSALPSPSQEQLNQAQTFFKSFLPPPTTKSTESPDPSEDSTSIVMDSTNVMEVPPANTEVMKPATELTLERSSSMITAPAIRKRSFNSSVCSMDSESSSSFKTTSSAESVSSVPSLKSLLRPNNFKSKLSTMLDDTASISTVDVSDDLAPDPKIFVMSSLRSSVGTTILTDDLAPDPFIIPSTQPPATAVVLSDELAPD